MEAICERLCIKFQIIWTFIIVKLMNLQCDLENTSGAQKPEVSSI